MTEGAGKTPTTLADYLAVLRRRKWPIIVMFVVALLSALVFSITQRPLYQATAQVLINRANIVSSITNVTDPSTIGNDPTRFLNTQSDVARSAELAQRVVAAAGMRHMTANELLANSSVNAASNADVLDISVSSPHPSVAARLANVYAQQYTIFKTDLDTARINDALKTLHARLKSLLAHRVSTLSPTYATLVQEESQLETVGKLLANNTQVLQQANGANQIRPRTKRNALLGGLFGAVLGIGLAFVAEALDRRARSEQEVEETLGLPLLARVPRPPRRLENLNRLVMISEPASIDAEPFRKLRTNLEFMNLDRRARTILVTSAVSREGKSTTIANLAVALARSGRKVALVDLDLRRPFLHRFFHVGAVPGVADVVEKKTKTLAALQTIPLTRQPPRLTSTPPESGNSGKTAAQQSTNSSNGRSHADGVLSLLPAGTTITDPGEFIGRQDLSDLVAELGEHFDYVLLDTPPLLAVGDSMALSPMVDAIVAVTRLRFVRSPLLQDFARQLESCQADKLGFVLAGAELEEGYEQSDYYYRYSRQEVERAGRERAKPVK